MLDGRKTRERGREREIEKTEKRRGEEIKTDTASVREKKAGYLSVNKKTCGDIK